jgi:hypothetical protein
MWNRLQCLDLQMENPDIHTKRLIHYKPWFCPICQTTTLAPFLLDWDCVRYEKHNIYSTASSEIVSAFRNTRCTVQHLLRSCPLSEIQHKQYIIFWDRVRFQKHNIYSTASSEIVSASRNTRYTVQHLLRSCPLSETQDIQYSIFWHRIHFQKHNIYSTASSETVSNISAHIT